MQKWEYTILHVRIGGQKRDEIYISAPVKISNMWVEKNADGRTDWDRLQDLGRNGWELVSVTLVEETVNFQNPERILLHSFKRPLQE